MECTEPKSGADGWIELPITSGLRRFAKPIHGTYGERGMVRYGHELPKHVREHFNLDRQNDPSAATAKRQELQQAISRHHEAWSNVNYWRIQEAKMGKRMDILAAELAKCESPNMTMSKECAESAEANRARLQDTLAEVIPALERASGLRADEFRSRANGDLTSDEVAALWMARAILERPNDP